MNEKFVVHHIYFCNFPGFLFIKLDRISWYKFISYDITLSYCEQIMNIDGFPQE